MSLFVVAFLLLFVFVLLSFRTWITWLSERDRDEYGNPLSDDWIPPRSRR